MIKFGLKIIRTYRGQNHIYNAVYDLIQINNKSYLIGKSELLFTIIKNIDILSSLSQNTLSLEDTEIKDYFRFLLKEINITKDDINNIKILSDLCFKLLKSPFYNVEILTQYFSIFNREDLLLNLQKGQFYSEYGIASIPYHYSLFETIKSINNNKQDYCIFTLHNIENLTDICLISLYEYINLKYHIRECIHCKNLFFANRNEYLCGQKNTTNNLVGCKKYISNQRAKGFQHQSNINKRKINIYNRLYRRCKRTPTDENLENLKNFSSGWKDVKRNSLQFPLEQQDIMLNSFLDKWDTKKGKQND